jgi:signal transduction histidine kinase
MNVQQCSQRLRQRPVDAALIDVALVVAGFALTVLAVKTPWAQTPRPVIAVSGLAGSLALGLRRRYPVTVTVVTAVAMALSGNPGPLIIALFCAAALSPRSWYPVLAVAGVAGFTVSDWVNDGRLKANTVLSGLIGTVLILGAGMFLTTRRQLVASLRDRAERVESERVLRDEHARAGERTRIAREMHDVLAHKIALISLHAGGLEVNSTAEPERIEQGAALIRSTAQEALDELRAVLGVLRGSTLDGLAAQSGPVGLAGSVGLVGLVGPGPHGGDDEPDPFADLARLVETWTEAGAGVSLNDEVGSLPPVTARTVYRLVQEGLTNAHRYAPGSPVTVRISGIQGQEILVSIVNGPARERAAIQAGSGVGLIGLAERLRLVGGTVTSGPDDEGGWRLAGQLPWPAPAHQQLGSLR